MVSVIGGASRAPVVFFARGGLGFTTPPAPPPKKPKLGSYCFKATCDIYSVAPGRADESVDQWPIQGCPVAKVTGYDTHPGVGKDTEYVCQTQVNLLGSTTHRCTEAQVVMLPNVRQGDGLECSGQMYFTMDDVTKKLL